MFRFLRREKKTEPVVDPYQDLKAKINAIRSNRAVLVYSPNNSTRTVRVPRKNIEEYIRYLKVVGEEVTLKRTIDSKLLAIPSSDRLLRDWFLNEEGYLFDSEEMVNRLKIQALAFVQVVSETKASQEVTTYSRLIANLEIILAQLVLVIERLLMATSEQPNEPLIIGLPSAVKDGGF